MRSRGRRSDCKEKLMSFELHRKKAFVCDLDGTLFMGPNPIAPAVKPIMKVSALKTRETSRFEAPIARRMPISLVRSSTLI